MLPVRIPVPPRANDVTRRRSGKMLVMFAVVLPTMFGVLGLVTDGGLLMARYRSAQHVADAAATAAAVDLQQSLGGSVAISTAESYVRQYNGMNTAEVSVNIPPVQGPYSGNVKFVEVIVRCPVSTFFIHLLGANRNQNVEVRAVAGSETTSAGSAIVILDPDPPPTTVPVVTTLFPRTLPTHYAGLEVPGTGVVKVDGAVYSNNQWGGVDQNGNPAGTAPGPPYGIACMPLVPLTSLRAREIRVVGGVDRKANYGAFVAGQSNPLLANSRPVPDPLRDLPVPTLAADSDNVSTASFGGVSVTGLPLIGPPKQLSPGVYDWIEVVSGKVVFAPGVYIIRRKNPATGISLNILAGTVTAAGVMFYITNSASYDPAIGAPDSGDGETVPPPPSLLAQTPSVVVNAALLGSRLTPLDDPGSPFDGILLYQRRADRRPILFVNESLIAGGTIAGTIYAKWGELVFTGQGTYDLRIAAGTVRFVDVLDITLAPSRLFPAVEDVFLVE